jgi:hypothetical protein
MKKITFFIAAVFLLPSIAFAHQVKSDRDIAVTMHMDPQDDPVVGEQATVYFSIKDFASKFKVDDCECRVQIMDNSRVLFDQQVATKADQAYGSDVLEIPVVFPERAIYFLHITGKSKTSAFQEFTINYDIRIDRENSAEIATPYVPSGQDPAVDHSTHNMGQQTHSMRSYLMYGALVALVLFGGILLVHPKLKK